MNKFEKFIEFSNEHLSSKDIDPVYFLLNEVNYRQGLSLEQKVWRCLLYVAWYRLASSEQVLEAYPHPNFISEEFILKTGIERRGFRGNNKAVEMINSFLKKHSIPKMIELYSDKKGEAGWEFIRQSFETIKWNGNWASYKWADLMKSVCGFEIFAPNVGGNGDMNHSPVKCFIIICDDLGIENLTKKEIFDNKFQSEIFSICKDAGAEWETIDQMETSLCDFKNVLNGKYYVGKDIDEILGYIDELPIIFKESFFDIFEDKYNGLKGGWSGIRKNLMK